ncbi:MAG: Ig-like domain-containing protein, partial [Clostridia bacterium]|nr:Ig-like domain-containing protein [Clostridia bacterium]
MKKILLSALIFILTLCMSAFFVACGGNGDSGKNPDSSSDATSVSVDESLPESEDPTGKGELTISKTALTLKQYETALLYCTKTNIPEETAIVWSSSDNETVSVGQDGKISALKVGTA